MDSCTWMLAMNPRSINYAEGWNRGVWRGFKVELYKIMELYFLFFISAQNRARFSFFLCRSAINIINEKCECKALPCCCHTLSVFNLPAVPGDVRKVLWRFHSTFCMLKGALLKQLIQSLWKIHGGGLTLGVGRDSILLQFCAAKFSTSQ